MRWAAVLAAILITTSSCTTGDQGPLPDAPTPVTGDELAEIVVDMAPAVVNVWASWCLPCRSEAPLIAVGSHTHPDVTFIGLNVKDSPDAAARFIADYLPDAAMIHLADASGRIPIDLGAGPGVPVTLFYASDGSLAAIHRGAIDEPAFARFLDEIDR